MKVNTSFARVLRVTQIYLTRLLANIFASKTQHVLGSLTGLLRVMCASMTNLKVQYSEAMFISSDDQVNRNSRKQKHFRTLYGLHKQTTEYLNRSLGYITRVTSTGMDASSPHCSYLSTCHYDEASKLECAKALCKAKGYPGGLFVESSNDFCVESLTADSVYVYFLDTNTIQISQENAESMITADCLKGKIDFPLISILKYKAT